MEKKIMIGIVVLVLIVGSVLFFSLRVGDEITGEVVEETGEVRKLIMVTSPYEPYASLDENGKAIGITVDVVDRIFTKLNVSHEVRIIPWVRAVKEAESGIADVLLNGAHTTEREEFLYYTEEELNRVDGDPLTSSYIIGTDDVYFVRNNFKEPLEIFDSFEATIDAGISVGAIAGWRSTKKLRDAGINVVEYQEITDQFKALVEGDIDIAYQDKPVGIDVLKKMGSLDMATPLNKTLLKDPLYLSFAKASDYPNLLEIREKYLVEIRKMHESGEYNEIYNSYT